MPMETYTPDYDFGQPNYDNIAKEFDNVMGLPYVGMSRWWRNAGQWKQFQAFKAKEYSQPRLVALYGKDHTMWKQEPAEVPLFGPFTGAQHEFGGNEFLCAAAQLAGWRPDDLGYWLLWADYRRRPGIYV